MTTHEARQDRARVGGVPWRLYAVEVRWGAETHTTTVAAPSRSSARYRHFLDISDAYPDLTFAGFQGMSSVRLAAGPINPDAYAYIRRAYGLDVAHGDRVSIRKEGAQYEGQQGTVVHPTGSTHYVHVVLDGSSGSEPGLFHPNSIVKLGDTPHPAAHPATDDLTTSPTPDLETRS